MMKKTKKNGLFESKALDSRIHSANTTGSEKALGYFLGPCLVYMAYYSIAGTYLTQFYTDVLGISGIFLTMMPVFSKIFDAITNIVMGRVIDKTHTRQGKARPWILISGFAMAICGILLYAVPNAGRTVQLVWIVVSYNLFFAFAFTIYNMSHTLMVPLSTRNTKQRDGLAMLTSTGTTMLPGLLVTIILPIMINTIGVGSSAKGSWMTVMSVLSILALPATLIEYYFTKERVTEESIAAGTDTKENTVSFLQQMKAAFSDPYWLIIIGFNIVYQIMNTLSTNSMIYYSNWVVADSVNGGTKMQVLINAIGQAPLGLGIFILWPLVRKFGKRMVTMFGFGIGALGSLLVLLTPGNVTTLLIGLVIKSFGALPTYCMAAMLAEALDHIEWKNGYRADGFSASVISIITTVAAGIGQSIIIGGISAFGYIAPTSNMEIIQQPDAMKTFFNWCFVGIPMIGYTIGSLLMLRFDVEDKMPQISADITARHKAEAEARGEVYYSTEEKAAMEQEEQEKIAEAKRIEELKAKCAKKGLRFEDEEAKYQAKLAAKKAKDEAKAAKKTKKK